MGSLFWRYVLTQWVVIALLMVLAVVAATAVATQRARVLRDMQPGNLVRAATQVARTEGEEGLKAWVHRIDRRQAALTIYLLRADGTDVLGKEVHPRVRYARDVRRHAPYPPGRLPDRNEPLTWWQSHQLTLPDGNHLQLVFLPFDDSRWDALRLSDMPLKLLAVALLLTLALCWLMTRHVTQPIVQLTLAARRLAKGQLDARAPPKVTRRYDALGQLARDFNTMSERIQKQVRVREHLLRHISHELRSPLTRLQLAVELASRQDERLPVQLARVVRESERLETLLQHTVELARMSELSAPAEHVDLADVIEEVVEDARFEITPQGARVQWQPQAGPVWVQADHYNLRSAIDNVVRNALRYGRTDRPVRIELITRDGQAVIDVIDGGPGVSDDQLAQIFEPFHRGAGHLQQEGSGLGLSIARACIQAHGGDITAGRLGDAKGFRVRMSLPLAPPPGRSVNS